MYTLTMVAWVLSVGLALAIPGTGCTPNPPGPKPVIGQPRARHVATWDAELKAVAETLAKLVPDSAPLEVGGTGPMSLRVISPATALPEEQEALEIGDTCSTAGSGILCTERAISSILTKRSVPVQPVLLFLIAHELDHLRHGEVRRFKMPPLVLKAGSTGQTIRDLIRPKACLALDPDELRADDFARDILGRAVAAGVFSSGGNNLGLDAVSVLNIMFEIAVQAPQGGSRSTAELLESLNAPTADEIEAGTRGVICMIAPAQPHDVSWQGFPGAYQTEGVRITRTADELADELANGKYGLAAHAGNLRELLRTGVDIQRVLMRQHADLVKRVVANVCKLMEQPQDPWNLLRCSALRPPKSSASAPKGCPPLEARPSSKPELSRPPPPAAVAMRARGAELQVSGAVTTATIGGRGDVVLAIGDRGQIVSWAPPASPSVIGEAGCLVGGVAEVGAALVAVCSDGGKVVRFDAGQRSTTAMDPMSIDGEVVPSARVRISWMGSVSGRVLAAVHLGSGQGILVEVTADKLRSVGAWTAPGCDALHFATRVTDVGGELWATPAHTAIEPQVIHLSADLGGVLEHHRPDQKRIDLALKAADLEKVDPRDDLPIMSCHASAARRARICVTVDGRFVDALDPTGKVVAQIASGVSFASRNVTARSCGTSRADYLLVTEEGAHAWVIELPAQSTRADLRRQAALDDRADTTDLTCGGDTAVLRVHSGGSSTVTRFGGAVK